MPRKKKPTQLELHFIPDGEAKQHITEPGCVCQPEVQNDPATDSVVGYHHQPKQPSRHSGQFTVEARQV